MQLNPAEISELIKSRIEGLAASTDIRNQGTVVKSLGLRRIRHSVVLKDTADVRGMIHKVRHLVEVTD